MPFLESQRPMIMGYLQSILCYFGIYLHIQSAQNDDPTSQMESIANIGSMVWGSVGGPGSCP